MTEAQSEFQGEQAFQPSILQPETINKAVRYTAHAEREEQLEAGYRHDLDKMGITRVWNRYNPVFRRYEPRTAAMVVGTENATGLVSVEMAAIMPGRVGAKNEQRYRVVYDPGKVEALQVTRPSDPNNPREQRIYLQALTTMEQYGFENYSQTATGYTLLVRNIEDPYMLFTGGDPKAISLNRDGVRVLPQLGIGSPATDTSPASSMDQIMLD